MKYNLEADFSYDFILIPHHLRIQMFSLFNVYRFIPDSAVRPLVVIRRDRSLGYLKIHCTRITVHLT